MKIRLYLLAIMSICFFSNCGRDLLFPIDRNELVGIWFCRGASWPIDICQSPIYDLNCSLYSFNADGTFTTSRSLEIDSATNEKKAFSICLSGQWEILSDGDYNVKFTIDGKKIYWNINIDKNNKDRMNVFEKDCDLFSAVFKKEE